MTSSTLRCKAIVFDFDGVLVDSVDVKGDAFYKLYSQFGLDVAETVRDHHRQNGGISRYEKIRHWHRQFLGISLDEKSVNALAEQFSQLVEEEVMRAPLVAGALEFIHKYHGEIPFFVASATPEEELARIMGRRDLQKFFSRIYGFPTTKANAIRDVMRNLSLKREEVAFVGDAVQDEMAAKEVGVFFYLKTQDLKGLEKALVSRFSEEF
jgi:phosphoglycolate phosphatase-like HAD superfamily hydrolase